MNSVMQQGWRKPLFKKALKKQQEAEKSKRKAKLLLDWYDNDIIIIFAVKIIYCVLSFQSLALIFTYLMERLSVIHPNIMINNT